MAGNVATPLPTNVASMKSRVADSSIQVRRGGGAPRRRTSVQEGQHGAR